MTVIDDVHAETAAPPRELPPPLRALAAQIIALRQLVLGQLPPAAEDVAAMQFDAILAQIDALAFHSQVLAGAMRPAREARPAGPQRPPVFHEVPSTPETGGSNAERPNPIDRLG